MAILASLPLVLAALTVPMLLWLVWYHSERVVYRGPAVVEAVDMAEPRVRPDRIFVVLVLPDQQRILADVPANRAASVTSGGKPVEVELRQRPIWSRVHVESIQWEKDKPHEKADQRFDGLFLSLYYLILGILLLSNPLPLLAAASIALAGFLTGGVVRSDIDYTRTPFASKVVLYVWLLVSGVATIMLFQAPGLHLFFPGVIVAYVFGQILGMLGQYWGQNERRGGKDND